MAEQARLHFQEELRELEMQALGGLDMVVTTLDRTLEALEHQDIELASIVIHDDDRIDGRYLEVQQGILSLLALQSPVASDLRVVAALLHVIKHVERMGDQCVNIAKMLPVVGYEPPKDEQMLEFIFKMGKLARSEVEQCKQAFLLRDVQVAEDLVRQDHEINRLNRCVFARAVEIGTDADRREWAMSMMLVARAIERIGDNAVDIGEQVAFVVTGQAQVGQERRTGAAAGGQATVRLAIIDSDTGFLQVLGKRLEGMGWQSRVLASPVPLDALVAMRLNAVVVDLAVLGPQGWTYLDKLCARLPGLGVIVCTGQSSVAQRVRGLRLGADDWVTKPCHPEELIARVEAVVRRRKRADVRVEKGPVMIGEVEIRADQFQAFVSGVSVE